MLELHILHAKWHISIFLYSIFYIILYPMIYLQAVCEEMFVHIFRNDMYFATKLNDQKEMY